jgi:hypothetical protein
LALGGGFARGIAHAGVLMAFERHGIPLHCVTGVSAGSIVAAAFASGTPPEEIARVGSSMRFRDVARWSLCRMGFMASERMKRFLAGLLKQHTFEDMRIPLGVLATDVCSDGAREHRVVVGVVDDCWRDDRRNDHRGQGCVALEDLSRAQSTDLKVLGEFLAAEHAVQLGEERSTGVEG